MRPKHVILIVLSATGCAASFDPDLSGLTGETTSGDGDASSDTGESTGTDTGTNETTTAESTTDDSTTDDTTSDDQGSSTGTDETTTAESTTGDEPPGLGEQCHFLHNQCDEGLTCSRYADPMPQDQIREWGCGVYVGEGPGDFGEPCEDDFGCANGFTCFGPEMLDEPVPYCDTSGGNFGCCTPYCESDEDCPGSLHCYYWNVTWDLLHPSIQQYGYPRFCVDDTWSQKVPPP